MELALEAALGIVAMEVILPLEISNDFSHSICHSISDVCTTFSWDKFFEQIFCKYLLLCGECKVIKVLKSGH